MVGMRRATTALEFSSPLALRTLNSGESSYRAEANP